MKAIHVKADTSYRHYYWMVSYLGLKGNEKDLFALIFSYSEANLTFFGSLRYTAELLNTSVQGIQKNYKSLLKKGYVAKSKKEIKGKLCTVYESCIRISKKDGFKVIKIEKNGHCIELKPINQECFGGSIEEDIDDCPEDDLPF
ncbi:MAG: hypothetical protein IKE59_04605 [Erysipelotrichaceae bacterium]|nr:hypothetical protein [Erysipelotrichaceae bacterium]